MCNPNGYAPETDSILYFYFKSYCHVTSTLMYLLRKSEIEMSLQLTCASHYFFKAVPYLTEQDSVIGYIILFL